MPDDFFALPPEVLTGLATVAAFALSEKLSAPQQITLGNFLFLMGQFLSTAGTQKQYLGSLGGPSRQELARRLDELEKRLGGDTVS